MAYTIDVKHDTQHRTWKRLSVTTISPDPLTKDLAVYIDQYARDHQMNPLQVAGRVVEIDSSQIESKKVAFKRIVLERQSNAVVNKPITPAETDLFWKTIVPYFGLDQSFDYDSNPQKIRGYLSSYNDSQQSKSSRPRT